MAALTLCAACANGGTGDSAAPVVRDSAGVRVVATTGSTAVTGWHVEPEAFIRIDPAATRAAAAQPANAFLHGGRLLVADGRDAGTQRLLVYDANGTYLAAWGESGGRLPCTFERLAWAAPFRGDSVAAYDEGRHAVSIFDPDGRCGRRMRLPNWRPAGRTELFAPAAAGVFQDGSLLAAPTGYVTPASGPGAVEWYVHELLRVAPDGLAWDTLGEFRVLPRTRTDGRIDWVPYAPTARTAVGRESFWSGTGESFEVREYARDGALLTILRRDSPPLPLTDQHRQWLSDYHVERARTQAGDSAAARTAADMAARSFPPHLPAYSRLLVDGLDNLWVEEYRWPDAYGAPADPPPARWSVFSARGEPVASLELPGRAVLHWVGRDEVIIFHHTGGTPVVAVHRLRRAQLE